jgi:serine/threonine protein kinase
MELANGGTLVQMLYTDHDWRTRLDVLRQLASGVKTLHENGILHGDIKLENVLIFVLENNTFQAKLSDFSHSVYQVVSDTQADSNKYYGTWPFIPLEVWTQTGEVQGQNCDIWAYGLLLWRVCQYRNDDAVEFLNFVPNYDDSPCDLDSNKRLKQWEAAKQKFVTVMKASVTIDLDDRDDIVSLFTDCIRSNPDKRCSAVDLQERLMTISRPGPPQTTGNQSSELDKASSNLQNLSSLENRKESPETSRSSIEIGGSSQQLPAWTALRTKFSIFEVS